MPTIPTPGLGGPRADLTRVPVHRFRAVFPIVNPRIREANLFAEARDALPRLARFHGVEHILSWGNPRVEPGRLHPGTAGAAECVVLDVIVTLTARAQARVDTATQEGLTA